MHSRTPDRARPECLVLRLEVKLSCHPSTCLRIGSKLRCIRSTPTEMQSIRENDFECFASTGVNTPGTMPPNRRDPVHSTGPEPTSLRLRVSRDAATSKAYWVAGNDGRYDAMGRRSPQSYPVERERRRVVLR